MNEIKIRYNYKFFSAVVFLIAVIPSILVAIDELKCLRADYYYSNLTNIAYVAILSWLFYMSKNSSIYLKLTIGKHGLAVIFLLALVANNFIGYYFFINSVSCAHEILTSVVIFLSNFVITAVLAVVVFFAYILASNLKP